MNEELKLIISAEVSKLKQGVDNAKQHIKTFKEQVREASADVDSKFAAIGEGMKNAASNIGIGIGAAAGALLALAGSTEEYRNQQAQLISSFEQTGTSAEAAKDVWNDLYRVLGDTGQAQEAAQHLAKLGVEEQALNEYTYALQGVYATFGASLPLEGLTEAINHTAKLGEVQGPLADALEWSGITTDEFNAKLAECTTESEREKLIRETLTQLYGDAAATYEENNKQVLAQRDAQMALQEKTAALGEALAPVITAFTNFANEALALVVPYITSLAEQYMPALEQVLSTVADALGVAFGFISENIGILATIAGIIGGITAAITLYNTVAAVKAAMDAAQVTTLGALVAAYAAQAAAMLVAIAPYALIVAAIAGLIAIIVVCVKHWDEIKAKIQEVTQKIKQWAIEAVDSIKKKFEEMKEKLTAVFNAVKEMMGKALGAAKETVSEKLANIKKAYEDNGGGIKGVVSGYMEAVKGFWTAGLTFIDKLTGGKLSNIAKIMREKMNTAKEAVSNALQGIKDKFSNIMESAKNIVSNAIDKIKGVFNFDWSLPKIKLPHFNVSGGKAPWGFMGEGSLPRISIDWYAKGGVFDSPTFFQYGGNIGGLGENGAEAIVPLERNTEWMDKLASMMSDKLGMNQPIVLNVDGKTFAQISVDSINQLTRQRGSIPLNII